MPKYDGARFNLWTVIDSSTYNWKNRYVTAQCQCGKVKRVYLGNLVNGMSQSCGCHRDRLTAIRSRRHGQSHTPEYKVWSGIKKRCYNTSSKSFRDYGARGIGMADDWRDSFESFIRDVGPRPSAKHTIERIDNDRGYDRGNCKWAIRQEQNNNTRRNHYVTHNGNTKTLADWARTLGWNQHILVQRLRRGWTFEQAISTPTLENGAWQRARGKKHQD